MATFSLFGTKMTVAKTPSWSKKGWVIKRVSTTTSKAQAAVRVALIDAAASSKGQSTGANGGLPGACVPVMNALSGKNFGGRSEAEIRARKDAKTIANRNRLAKIAGGR